jgi:hypothetical protein
MRPCALALACLLLVPIAAPARAGETPPATAAPHLILGPAVTNAAGQQGRLHTVASGETLWDISEAYLGTPWVWSSVWKDDSGSGRDPAIKPGDVLWVSSTEIRRLTPVEVSQLGASAPTAPPASMEAGTPDVGVSSAPLGGLSHWVGVQATGFLSPDRIAAVGTVIGNPTPRAALGTGDAIYIDMGAGQVQVGDRLRIMRVLRHVPDPDSGRLLGTFVEPIAWAEVTVLEGEAATAVIHGAVTDVNNGDILLPVGDGEDPARLTVQSTPLSVHGEIVHMVADRQIVGGMDVVYLDLGSEAGLTPGSALEVVRPGGKAYDRMRDRSVKVPDTIIGQMVVLSSTPTSAAAYVVHATTDLARGDRYRGAEVH